MHILYTYVCTPRRGCERLSEWGAKTELRARQTAAERRDTRHQSLQTNYLVSKPPLRNARSFKELPKTAKSSGKSRRIRRDIASTVL